MRWEELQSGLVEDADLTEVSQELFLKKNHPGMICLKMLEERRRDPTPKYVLKVHG